MTKAAKQVPGVDYDPALVPSLEPPTPPVMMTADELLALPTGMGERYELIEGRLVTMAPTGWEHGQVSRRVAGALHDYLTEHADLGDASGAETGFLVTPEKDTVRAPDSAFVRAEKLLTVTDPERFLPFAPDLAVEVVSPRDSYSDTREKALMWLDAGSEVVWVVDPQTRSIEVYQRGSDTTRTLRETDTLDGGALLPGFAVPVTKLFPPRRSEAT